MSFSKQVVFIAGGSSGINLGIADAFAQAGASVAILGRSQDKLDAAVAQLLRHGGEVRGFAADVRDFDGVATALAATTEQLGPIDVLVSGAAGNFLAPAANMSSNAFRTVVDIDLLGTFNVLRAAFPHLRKPGARIVNISAGQSWMPTPLQAHVCAAKAGVDQLTRTLAIEWGQAGVRVNSIAPGPIEGTEGMARLVPNAKAHAAWVRSVPLGRFGQLEDISNAALWLCSPQAGYVTGVVLSVDGGLALGGSGAITQALIS
ncbi:MULTISPECIES: SDR family oxidoreductase [unclassified Pseudomonas]|uniref:SDR family oxidoreductase n=1 Tax=unclassified Pseudomonas TaxID=196821 RepID=UPI002446D324|nr:MULTISPECIES: SDR family oxidoreductase [unclassified Pseudomonas]MDG9931066.1 SDR family oxidoreductase [Pseudomonas sp. GD04042]MDH0485533.1 SDR family oxidoreductase [Pseudomonas sp. GD04015]MDH0606894.1 SDR family oxidoreductase [Pseudomonas sp. GD03869]